MGLNLVSKRRSLSAIFIGLSDEMCGGFNFSKNALTALNIVYIVSLFCVCLFVFDFIIMQMRCLLFIAVGWVHPDWCRYLWKSFESGHEPTYHWWDCGLRCFSPDDLDHGSGWSCQAPPSSSLLCILFS